MREVIRRSDCIVYTLTILMRSDVEARYNKRTSAWICALSNEEETNYYTSLDETLNYLFEICAHDNVLLFSYNLGIEWRAIFPLLRKRGFEYGNGTKTFHDVAKPSRNKVYEAVIEPSSTEKKIILRGLNSMLLPQSLEETADAFGLTVFNYTIDREKIRPEGYIPTAEEKEYVGTRNRAIFDILKQFDALHDRDFWNSLTVASYSMQKLINHTYYGNKRRGAFRSKYPALDVTDDAAELSALLSSYEGGLIWANPEFQYKEIDVPVMHVDAHQMYPTQMYTKLYPCGKGTHFVDKPPFITGINLLHINLDVFDYIFPIRPAWIGMKFGGNGEMWLWDFELKLMKKLYPDMNYTILEGYCYKAAPLDFRNFYKENYDKRHEARVKGDRFGVYYYKLLNNASYGKLSEKTYNQSVVDVEYTSGHFTNEVEQLDKKQYGGKYTYMPVGSCTTAYARCCLLEAALEFGVENVIAMSTDCLFLIRNEKTIKVWQSMNQSDMLGGWGLEGIYEHGLFTAPNRYKMWDDETKYVVKASGFNGLTFTSDITSTTHIVDVDVAVDGGVITIKSNKKMGILAKYEDTYEDNAGEVIDNEIG